MDQRTTACHVDGLTGSVRGRIRPPDAFFWEDTGIDVVNAVRAAV